MSSSYSEWIGLLRSCMIECILQQFRRELFWNLLHPFIKAHFCIYYVSFSRPSRIDCQISLSKQLKLILQKNFQIKKKRRSKMLKQSRPFYFHNNKMTKSTSKKGSKSCERKSPYCVNPLINKNIFEDFLKEFQQLQKISDYAKISNVFQTQQNTLTINEDFSVLSSSLDSQQFEYSRSDKNPEEASLQVLHLRLNKRRINNDNNNCKDFGGIVARIFKLLTGESRYPSKQLFTRKCYFSMVLNRLEKQRLLTTAYEHFKLEIFKKKKFWRLLTRLQDRVKMYETKIRLADIYLAAFQTHIDGQPLQAMKQIYEHDIKMKINIQKKFKDAEKKLKEERDRLGLPPKC